jgi:hypothetical protein
VKIFVYHVGIAHPTFFFFHPVSNFRLIFMQNSVRNEGVNKIPVKKFPLSKGVRGIE